MRKRPIISARLAILIVILIALAGFGYIITSTSALKGISFGSTSTTSVTTTIVQNTQTALSGCTGISESGKYYMPTQIKTGITSGACINVTASNVNINCDNNELIGSGPLDGIPPFTYGIEVSGHENVSVTGCIVKNFSYGLYAISSQGLNISDNNLSVNYMANIYLGGVHNSTVRNNYMSKSSSEQGSLYLTGNTSGTQIYNNTIRYNQFYGVSVNASNNTFIDNIMNGTQYSLKCSTPNGFVISSRASSNLCYNDTGCGFLECRGINIPANLSQIGLGNSISTCGSIDSPGIYSLQSDLNMQQFVNTSNPLSWLIPCISVRTKNVRLDCNGLGIFNATTAIQVQNESNITIENCRISNSKDVGVFLANVSQSHLQNLSLLNDNFGVSLYNDSVNTFSNVSASQNMYGMYLSGSYANNFHGLNLTYNNYGVYMETGSLFNSFINDVITNSSSVDVYTSPDTSNATVNIMQSTVCGTTDAIWAACKKFIYTLLPYNPVSSCGSISTPGNYLLTGSLFNAAPQCIKIASDNVRFNCSNHIIAAPSIGVGSGMSVSNSVNVSIMGCNFDNFVSAINVSNSSYVNVYTTNVQGGDYGITLNRVNWSLVSGSTINSTSNVSILMRGSSNTTILDNNMSLGRSQNIGILMVNSTRDRILNNNGSGEYIGLELEGSSLNNTVLNNTMEGSTYADFVCLGGNSGLGAGNGNINYGEKKLGCYWLAALTRSGPTAGCIATNQADIITLSQDALYTFGTICLTISSNTSAINCMGHTVIATNGGTFAQFRNAQNTNIENCYLKGFTSPISAFNSSLTVLNNTILDAPGPGSAISVAFSRTKATVKSNNVSTEGIGINLSSDGYGYLQNNYVANASYAYVLSNMTEFSVTNNTASSSTANGILMVNSTEDQFQNNKFMSSGLGMVCETTSQSSVADINLGNNACSVQSNCGWMSGAASCPS